MTWTDQMMTAYPQGTYILMRDATEKHELLVGHDKVAQHIGDPFGEYKEEERGSASERETSWGTTSELSPSHAPMYICGPLRSLE